MSQALRTPETVADTGLRLRINQLEDRLATMSRDRQASFSIHGDPVGADVHTPGNLSLRIEGDSKWAPSITVYCGTPALAFDLAAAINAVIATHAAPALKVVA